MRSPIILTLPCNYGGTFNTIIAKNFRTFLRLLLHHGWFELTELSYQPETALQRFLEGARTINRQREDNPEYIEQERLERELCAFAAGLFDLKPYFFTETEFQALQQKHLSSLLMPKDFDP